MTAADPAARGKVHAIRLDAPDDFDAWRDHARALVQCGVAPDRVLWSEPGGSGDLFGDPALPPPVPPADAPQVRASKAFVDVAHKALLHRAEDRFALLYRLLWRLQANPRLMEDSADRDVGRAHDLAKAVRRDIHKMHAFVRFRQVDEPADAPGGDGGVRYVAWFEPEHNILRATAGFFIRRFANMRWSILTPDGALHWDGETLVEGPPASRADAPDGDPVEELWRRYYASIFNPARLKVGAMLKEMPRKYWKNLPEAALIPELVAGAQSREAAMIDAGAPAFGERPGDLAMLAAGLASCRACPIGALDNRSVPGEGPHGADPAFSGLMIVGEQPGDEEDRQGRPFVGPAGQLLDDYLAAAGIGRQRAYVTNAVKHFKYVPRGKRRLHQTPTAREIDVCRWWLESERALVAPRLVLALGASAARGLLGRTVSIARERGRPHRMDDGGELWVTVHPSYLLRLDGEAREAQADLFRHDLVAVEARLREIAGQSVFPSGRFT